MGLSVWGTSRLESLPVREAPLLVERRWLPALR